MVVPIVLVSIIAFLAIALIAVQLLQSQPRRPHPGGRKKRKRTSDWLDLVDPNVGRDLTFGQQNGGGFVDGNWANMGDIGGGDIGNGFS